MAIAAQSCSSDLYRALINRRSEPCRATTSRLSHSCFSSKTVKAELDGLGDHRNPFVAATNAKAKADGIRFASGTGVTSPIRQ
jgi:hypothetical protein